MQSVGFYESKKLGLKEQFQNKHPLRVMRESLPSGSSALLEPCCNSRSFGLSPTAANRGLHVAHQTA